MMNMNRNLLKKIVSDVSVPTLCGIMVEYANEIIEADENGGDYTEILVSLDTVSSELRSRKAKAAKQPKPKPEQAQTTAANNTSPPPPKTDENDKGSTPTPPPPVTAGRIGNTQ